ncbi:MAG: hypothetical protein Q8R82_19610 [Hyphomonadaceae bacterium]|nr:hypothetical protein [Hyphomonadaceae bacterium]
MKLRRDIVLFIALAIVAAVGGVFLLLNRPGAAVDSFLSDTKARVAAARPNPANAESFRATVCSAGPCVLVEAGGLAILVGAGEGAADGLRARGLMRADLDAIVVPDLALDSIAGLPGLSQASLQAGRKEPLKVYGPAGIVPVIDGANLMLAGEPGVRLGVGTDREDQGLEGLVVFDSGVVAVRAFGGRAMGEGRVYRVDFEGKSLIIAGCRAMAVEIVSAARGTQSAAGILAAGSSRLEDNQDSCLPVGDVLAAAGQARLAAILLSPLRPSAAIPGSLNAWREVIAGERVAGAVAGGPGSVIDLSAEKPVVRPAN